MSLLSDFLSKQYLGLSVSTGILTFSSTNAQVVLASTDTSGGGISYPRLILRNANSLASSGAEVYFQTNNSTPGVFTAAAIRGKLTTITAGAEIGRLDLVSYVGGSYTGIVIENNQIRPLTHGGVSLGTASAGWSALHLYSGAVTASVTPGSTLTVQFGGTNALIRSASKAVNLFITDFGASIFHPGTGNDTLLNVGSATNGTTYYSQTAGTTGKGLYVDMGVPSTVTAAGIACDLRLSTQAAAFTLTQAFGLRLSSISKGAGSAITTLYGIFVDQMLGATNNYGVFISAGSTAEYALVNNTGMTLLGGDTRVGNQHSTTASAGTAVLDVADSDTGIPLLHVRPTSTSFVSTAVLITGPDAESVYNCLRITDAATADKFIVRGDGAVLIGTATVLNTSSVLTVNGRASIAANNTYDLVGSTTADSLNVSGTATVGGGQYSNGIAVRLTGALSSVGVLAGITSAITLSTHSAGNSTTALFASVAAAGTAGNVWGAQTQITTAGGNTANLCGWFCTVGSQATSLTTYGLQVHFAGTAPSSGTTAGVLLYGDAGYALANAVDVGGSLNITGAALRYNQRSGSTGKFLHFIDSGAADRFVVDSAGDITIGGVGRRIRADMSDSTHANRLAFQTSAVNSATILCAIPNGSSTDSAVGAWSGSTLTAANRVLLRATSSEVSVWSLGLGVADIPLALRMGSAGSIGTAVAVAHINFDFQAGGGLSGTTATAGFLFVPDVSGTPTGVPTTRAGWTPMLYDKTANKVWFYNGSWRGVVVA